MNMQVLRDGMAGDAIVPGTSRRADAGYAATTGRRWPALAVIALLHGGALWAAIALDVVAVARAKPRLTVVELVPDTIPPPPEPRAAPQPPAPDVVRPVAPPPIVTVTAPPAPVIRTVAVAPPPAPVQTAPPAPPASPGPPDDGTVPPDFAGRQLGNVAPRYPVESRRKREQGTVVVRVRVESDGSAGDCKVRRSSGHERLDNAALSTVCRWRFQPATRAGTAVAWPMDVPIPFVLRS